MWSILLTRRLFLMGMLIIVTVMRRKVIIILTQKKANLLLQLIIQKLTAIGNKYDLACRRFSNNLNNTQCFINKSSNPYFIVFRDRLITRIWTISKYILIRVSIISKTLKTTKSSFSNRSKVKASQYHHKSVESKSHKASHNYSHNSNNSNQI